MTGFESKRQAAQAKLPDEAETTHDYRFRYDRACYKCHSMYCPRDCKDTTPPHPSSKPLTVAYDKTAMNCFVQRLYDSKMKEGKHGHYETMFHVVHQAIKRFAPPQQQAEPGALAHSRHAKLMAKFTENAEAMKALAQAEPAAYFDFQELKFSWAKHMQIGPVPMSIKVEPIALYTAPPQRQWVGLTDEEMSDTVADMDVDFGDLLWKVVCLTKIIEAKLKERNT